MNTAPDLPLVVTDIVPISRRSDAGEVATAAYEQLLGLLGSLEGRDWDAQTECPRWTVADVVGHLIGGRSFSSWRGFVRYQMYGLRHRGEFDGNAMYACNARDVAKAAELTPIQRVQALTRDAPAMVAGRMRLAPVLSLVNASVDQGGSTAAGMPRKVNGGHLLEVILTRDVWLHTVDIARAVGREPDVSAPFNKRVIEDVVAEWAGRHAQPFELRLSGPAGGTFTHGAGGERLSLDAVEFTRALSGRAPGAGLLATRVLF